MDEMGKIIGIGNALVDELVRLESDLQLQALGLPKGSMTLVDDEHHASLRHLLQGMEHVRAAGGSSSNTMQALARLGAPVAYVGRVANDDVGTFFQNSCRQSGVEPRLIVAQGHSGVANTFVSPDGERTFATYLGVADLKAGDICPALFEGGKYLYVEGYLVSNHYLMERVCTIARDMGLRIAVDLASYNVVEENLKFFRYIVNEYTDVVFANEKESRAFTGKEPAEALKEIAGMCDVVVVKLGRKGASAMCGYEQASVPAIPVHVVDTTAAGDFFAAGFLYAFSRGASLRKCLDAGTLLSCNIIQVMGTGLDASVWDGIRLDMSRILN